jgi:hypothetical protein
VQKQKNLVQGANVAAGVEATHKSGIAGFPHRLWACAVNRFSRKATHLWQRSLVSWTKRTFKHPFRPAQDIYKRKRIYIVQ